MVIQQPRCSPGVFCGDDVNLAQNAMFYTVPDDRNKRQERIQQVTVADVQRVAKQYLVKTNRSVVITMPKTAARGGN